MSTTLQLDERDVPTVSDIGTASRVARVIAGLLAVIAVAIAAVGAQDHDRGIAWAALVLVSVFALSTFIVAIVRPREPMWLWLAGGTISGALALLTDRAAGVVPVAAGAIAVALPDGWVRTRAARVALGLVAAIGIPSAVIVGLSDAPSRALLTAESLAIGVVAVVAYAMRCRNAAAVERARLQWAGWGAFVAGACALVVWLMHQLIGWPDGLGAPIVVLSASIPFAITLASFERLALRVDRLLVRTIEAGGLVALVGVVYVVVVLGFGDSPTDASRRVLGLSLVAAAIAALLFVPARNWLEELANRRVYGEQRAPDEPLQTFGARMSRAIPLDELLLQLAESLKKSMQLSNAEVWTGTDGVFERAAAVPYRDVARVRLNEEEAAIVARAHVSGNAWIQVWLPAVLAEHPGRTMRVAPLVLSGELFGFILCARPENQQPFSSEDERVLTDLARQVAVALHNSALDTALQASLDDLRVANEELRASRSRIVATADQSRRQIERNLHDGAQQHLVALAVKLGLARQLVDGDREALAALLEELRGDAQTTLTELRELAHGIYPPLLMDRGLREALVAAANRSVLPTEVEADVGRYPSDVEAAIYFCCLEALQNAGKHAGETATIRITLSESDGMLRFQVADNGAGFDANSSAGRGHGFVNMADRLGAIGGKVEVDSAPGEGTRIRGRGPARGSRLGGRPAVPELTHEGRTEVLLVHVRHRAAFLGVVRQVGFGVRRQQDDGGLRVGGPDPAGRLDPVHAGQVDVHQHEVGRPGVDLGDRLLGGGGLGGHRETGGHADHRPRDGPERQLIVHDQHRHGLGGAVRGGHVVHRRARRRSAQGGNLRRSGVLASLLGQVQQDGLHPPVDVHLGGEAELREQGVDVLLDRAFRQEQRLRDPGVVATLRHLVEHFALTRCETLEGGRPLLLALRHERLDDDRIDHAAATRDVLDRTHDLRRVRDALLQEVRAPLGPALEERERIGRIDVLGQHDDADAGLGIAQRERGADALVGTGGRHPDIGDDDVGVLALDRLHELVVGAARSAYRQTGLVLEQRDDALANQQIVLGNHHPQRHWHTTLSAGNRWSATISRFPEPPRSSSACPSMQ